MPRRTREAMLRGLDGNKIIVGAYTDKRGGVCPMLAAHRNGGRTDLSSFARSWDRFTGAVKGRSRRASRRELTALRSYLEHSLLRDEQDDRSVAELAAEIRHQRRTVASAPAPGATESRAAPAEPAAPAERSDRGDRDRRRELRRRLRWAWLIPARRYDTYARRVAAAEEQAAELRAADLLDARERLQGEPSA